MSNEKWKPGDVAMVQAKGGPSEDLTDTYLMSRWRDGWALLSDPDWFWRDADLAATPLRRLAVIDAEAEVSGAVIDAFKDAWLAAALDGKVGGDRVRAGLGAALRVLAPPTPPRPDEPGAWGAVVEDDTGAYWTLYAPEAGAWINYREGKRSWSDIDVVRVLSEGVS